MNPSTTDAKVSLSQQGGSAVVRFQNDLLVAEVLPEHGCKVWSFKSKKTGREWIWHNPKIWPRKLSAGAGYDDNWSGGWEELFPNDAAGTFEGRELPDHGEWWNSPWHWKIVTDQPGTAKFWLETKSIKTRAEKEISLVGNRLLIQYRIQNLEKTKINFLFKQHLAVAVRQDYELELPGGRVTQVDPAFSTRIGSPAAFSWPNAPGPNGEVVDLSKLPDPKDNQKEFVYVSELPEGWCGAKAPDGERIRLCHDRRIFPHTWLFMTFGGWRNLYTVVLEPCTNKPKDLNEAVRLGQCANLAPGEVLACAVWAELS
jgi:hypothetical protein